jgi:hypothetical protein
MYDTRFAHQSANCFGQATHPGILVHTTQRSMKADGRFIADGKIRHTPTASVYEGVDGMGLSHFETSIGYDVVRGSVE